VRHSGLLLARGRVAGARQEARENLWCSVIASSQEVLGIEYEGYREDSVRGIDIFLSEVLTQFA
jgi:hypothetical protein